MAILAPSPILTVTLEGDGDASELHMHPGGQGFWVGRMLREFGVNVTFCAPLGGEVGIVLSALLASFGFDLRAVEAAGCNGAYVHRRRGEGFVVVGETASPRLSRHEADDLYSVVITAALRSDVTVLTGPRGEDVIDPDFYRRIAGNLRANGRLVVADLSGSMLAAALDGGVDVLHVSLRELREFDGGDLIDRGERIAAIERVHEAGARQVILTSGPGPSLVRLENGIHELTGPVFDPREHRGSGDAMIAVVAASLARGLPIERALRLGAAAGSLNVVRRGLGSGSREDIERLGDAMNLRPL